MKAPAIKVAAAISGLYQAGDITSEKKAELTSVMRSCLKSGIWQEMIQSLFALREQSTNKYVIDEAIDAAR